MNPELPIGYVFLGLSVDGFIARPDGDLTWLLSRGEAAEDAGYTPFVQSVDAILLGRSSYEAIAGEPEWEYHGKPVHVLSTTLATSIDPRVTAVHSEVPAAVASLLAAGHRRVYVDGGQTVRAFLDAGQVAEMTLSQVPVLIGSGISLFGSLRADIDLEHVRTAVLPGGMVQTTYRVRPE